MIIGVPVSLCEHLITYRQYGVHQRSIKPLEMTWTWLETVLFVKWSYRHLRCWRQIATNLESILCSIVTWQTRYLSFETALFPYKHINKQTLIHCIILLQDNPLNPEWVCFLNLPPQPRLFFNSGSEHSLILTYIQTGSTASQNERGFVAHISSSSTYTYTQTGMHAHTLTQTCQPLHWLWGKYI